MNISVRYTQSVAGLSFPNKFKLGSVPNEYKPIYRAGNGGGGIAGAGCFIGGDNGEIWSSIAHPVWIERNGDIGILFDKAYNPPFWITGSFIWPYK